MNKGISHISIAASLAVMVFALVFFRPYGALAAAPLVGTEIVNQASISYKDVSGTERLATTNEVVITVNQVYSTTLSADQTLAGASGQSVTFFHILTNNGNGPDTYTIAVADNNTVTTPDDGNFDLITVYHDTNSNGQLDSGEPAVGNTIAPGTLTLDAGDVASLLVMGQIPTTAVDDDALSLTLSVTTANGGMDDTGGNNDTLETTNEDTVVITSNAILLVTKSSTYNDGATADDLSDDAITYTITVANIGTADAQDVILFDGIPQDMQFVAGTIASANFGDGGDFSPTSAVIGTGGPLLEDGLRGGSGADLNGDGDLLDGTETQLGIDLNTDSDLLDDDQTIIYGVDDALTSGASVSFSYQVEYVSPATIAAATIIENTAHTSGDIGGGTLAQTNSNTVQNVVPAFFGVTITDTGIGAGAAVNDGGDDDGAADDSQYVDTVERGATVLFTNIITNGGNGPDSFDLAVTASTFPVGTVFQYFAADGISPLLDSNGNSIVDSGIITSGTTRTIVVRAILPYAAAGGPYSATITATSTGDPSKTDTVDETLGSVQPSRVDLANSAAAAGFNDAGVADADSVASVTTTLTGVGGETLSFSLWLANEGYETDSYLLSVWADAAATTALPDGWQVVFKNTDGQVITNTPAIPAGSTYNYVAEVSSPANSSPGTTSLFFKVVGSNVGSSDTKQDAVQINTTEAISITPDQSGTITPCSSTEYTHIVSNNGDTAEEIILSVTSQTTLSHVLLLPIASSGSEASSFVPVQSLSIGSNVAIYDASATGWTTVALTDDGAGGIAVPLDPGDTTRVRVRIFAPCSTPEETLDILVLNARVENGAASEDARDQTKVSSGYLGITKLGAIDTGCDGTADGVFASAQLSTEPATCVIWQITAINHGSKTVCNVTIQDTAPPFTLLNGGSPAVIVTEPLPGTGVCAVNGQNISCTIGNAIDITGDGTPDPHCLKAGETAVIHFRVQVQ